MRQCRPARCTQARAEEAVGAALQAHAAIALGVAELAVVAQLVAEDAHVLAADLGVAARADLEVAYAFDDVGFDGGAVSGNVDCRRALPGLRRRRHGERQRERERREAQCHGAGELFSLVLEFSMIHVDVRRAALEEWLHRELGGASFSLTPASEDASFRRYFRATLADDGATRIVMDAPPDKEDCRPCAHRRHADRGWRACAAGVGLRSRAGLPAPLDLGTRTYLNELRADNATALFGDATDALMRWQLATRPGELPPYDEALLAAK